MSGRRNEPPISISSPRETIVSLPVGQRVQRQHQRAGIVVDGERRLGAGQPLEPARDMVVALAAAAGLEIVFERRGLAHRLDRRRDRLLGQRRAAEIGVQHGAGQVEDAALRGPRQPRERGGAVGDDARPSRPRRLARPALRQRRADRVEHERAAVALDQGAAAPRIAGPDRPPAARRGLRRPCSRSSATRRARARQFAQPGSSRTRGSIAARGARPRPIAAAR